MYIDKYFKVKNSIKTDSGWICKGVILYCYCKNNNMYYFKDVMSASLAVILREKDINCDLDVINSVDKLKLFHIHSKNILNDVLPMYDFLLTAEKYVIDDLKLGKIDNAFYALETDIDKIRYSYLGEQLKLYCISL